MAVPTDGSVIRQEFMQTKPMSNKPLLLPLALTSGLVLITIVCSALGYLPLINTLLLAPFALGLSYLGGMGYLGSKELSNRGWFTLVLLPTIVVGFVIAIYRPHGFNYPLIWQTNELYPGGKPFSLYLNLSKALGGYLVIVAFSKYWFKREAGTLPDYSILQLFTLSTGAVAIIVLSAHWIFGVAFVPKLPSGIGYFIAVNLFATVVAEEAFFRLLLQQQIQKYFANANLGMWVSTAGVAVIFAFAHSAAVGKIFFLYLLAGFIYGFVYSKTQRLSLSIAVHLGVNLLHFTLLEYPL